MNIRGLCRTSALYLSSFGLFLIAAEILVRITYQNPVTQTEHDSLFCYDAYFGWDFCKSVVGRVVSTDYDHAIRTDENGQRDFGGLDAEKNNIVVLGDSFTSNIGIENISDVFTEVLEQRLQNFNVVNLGVNGYGTTQEYLKLERSGSEYDPDIVILMFYVRNDFYDNVGLLDWINGYGRPRFIQNEGELSLVNIPVPRKPVSPDIGPESIAEMLVRRSEFAALARTALMRTEFGQLFTATTSDMPPEVVLASEEDSASEAYSITCNILGMISTQLRQSEVEFYVVVIPSIFQVRDDYFEKIESFGLSQADRFKPNELLGRCGEAMSFPVFDLAPFLVVAENKHTQPYMYYPQEHHWTIAGNKFVADLIFDELKTRSIAIRQSDSAPLRTR